MFDNYAPGPLISLTILSAKNSAIDEILDEGFIVVACITDKRNPLYKVFKKDNPQPEAVLVTVQYINNYE